MCSTSDRALTQHLIRTGTDIDCANLLDIHFFPALLVTITLFPPHASSHTSATSLITVCLAPSSSHNTCKRPVAARNEQASGAWENPPSLFTQHARTSLARRTTSAMPATRCPGHPRGSGGVRGQGFCCSGWDVVSCCTTTVFQTPSSGSITEDFLKQIMKPLITRDNELLDWQAIRSFISSSF